MNITILSRGPTLYSTQSLVRACQRRGHHAMVIDHAQCDLLIEKGLPQIYYEGRRLYNIDAVIPRIGASITTRGAAVINQFEMMQIFTTLQSEALLLTRDKLKCLQKLSSVGIDIPKTAFANTTPNLNKLIAAVGGVPVVIKLVESTHGTGVILADSKIAAKSTIETLLKLKERVLIQEFIKEADGADIRALVVGNRVVGSMIRKAQEGEFRSNLHRGASSKIVRLTEKEEKVALHATKVMGLNIAGVDILRSKRGPLIMEVNASPGLEGIETTTGVDIAGEIINFVEKNYKKVRNTFAYRRMQRAKV